VVPKFEKLPPSTQQAPSDPRPVKYRLADLPTIPEETVGELKGRYVAAMRATAKASLSAERVGVTWYVVGAWLEADGGFREDVEHARQCRIDEIEADLEGSTNRSGGDVTARIFMLKGMRPEKYQERIVQQTFVNQVVEPEFEVKGVEGSREDRGEAAARTH